MWKRTRQKLKGFEFLTEYTAEIIFNHRKYSLKYIICRATTEPDGYFLVNDNGTFWCHRNSFKKQLFKNHLKRYVEKK